MQEAGGMWGQAEELAKRTVQELSRAAQRITWLEQELSLARSGTTDLGTHFASANPVLSHASQPLSVDLQRLESHLAATEALI
eukprot:scaffold448139_cov45-Prasinocladus_malaysianus.AAC.1